MSICLRCASRQLAGQPPRACGACSRIQENPLALARQRLALAITLDRRLDEIAAEKALRADRSYMNRWAHSEQNSPLSGKERYAFGKALRDA